MDTAEEKPRASWGRAIKRGSLWLVGIVVTLTFLLWLVIIDREWKQFQQDRAGYMGIKLGVSMDEAYYTFGVPTYVLGPLETAEVPNGWDSSQRVYIVDGSDPKNSMPDGKDFKDFLDWQINKNGREVNLSFDPKTKRITKITCQLTGPNDPAGCPRIFGVSNDNDEDELVEHLGSANAYEYTGPSKGLRWNGIGIEIQLMEKRPYMITKNSDSKAGFLWFISHRVL